MRRDQRSPGGISPLDLACGAEVPSLPFLPQERATCGRRSALCLGWCVSPTPAYFPQRSKSYKRTKIANPLRGFASHSANQTPLRPTRPVLIILSCPGGGPGDLTRETDRTRNARAPTSPAALAPVPSGIVLVRVEFEFHTRAPGRSTRPAIYPSTVVKAGFRCIRYVMMQRFLACARCRH